LRIVLSCALTIAAALLPAAGTARAEWLTPHAVACYETTDLEFIVRYYRPGISNQRQRRCFTPPQGQEVTVLRYADTNGLSVSHFVLAQPRAGGQSFWTTEPSLIPFVEPTR
jgi:hypothetical protein